MLHLMLLNECLLHYFSFMCVTMMVFSVCLYDTVHLLFMFIFKSCFLCALVHHVTFSSPPALWLSVYYKGKKQISVLQ